MKNKILPILFFVSISICGMAQTAPPPPPLYTAHDSIPASDVSVGHVTEEVSDPYHAKDSGEVFTFVEEMPKFPGGAEELKKFLVKNTKFPKGSGCKEGTVYIHFVVERDGRITHIQPRKEVPGAPELTKEALRVVAAMPNWSSGKLNGHPVRDGSTCQIHATIIS